MSHIVRGVLMLLMVLSAVALVSAQNDRPGSKDPQLFTRMAGFYIQDYKDTEFDSFSFPVGEIRNAKRENVEGHKIMVFYILKKDFTPEPSALQVVRNYEAAAKSLGGEVLHQYDGGGIRRSTLRIVQGSTETWVYVDAWPRNVKLNIVEKKTMRQDVVADASAFANDLKTTGKVAIYGIYFDSAKADIKPESEPALVEIGKLMKLNPTLKVYVVGHTDMVGDVANNLKLSQARAQAVVTALTTKHGIERTRLLPFGAGPYAPVASNKDEDGRAKNRRVELVEVATM